MHIREKLIRSWDGTHLMTYDTTEGSLNAILCNGLGGDIRSWRPILDRFYGRIRFISWDYRGLYKSEKSKNKDHYRIEHHAKDIEVIMERFGIKKAAFFGWSMGVQVCLEFYRNHQEKFNSMILINGVAGKPFEKAFHGKIPNFVWQAFFYFMKDGLRTLFPIVKLLAKKSLILKLASSLGLYNISEYKDVAKEIILSWLSLDMKEYVKNFANLGKHSAEDILAKIKCPTLIIYGTRDLFTPQEFAIKMAQTIRVAEMCRIEKGTHYTPLEFPDIVSDSIERFFKKHTLLL